MSKAVQNLQIINEDDEWETPNDLLFDAQKKYQIFPEVDVFATNRNYKFPRYFTKENSAYFHQLNRDSFANPPYSEINEAMKFLYYQHLSHNVNILALTYAKTDTKWWHSYIEDRAEVHFIKGRLKFEKFGSQPKYCNSKLCKHYKKTVFQESPKCEFCDKHLSRNVAPYPSCWIIYRKQKI